MLKDLILSGFGCEEDYNCAEKIWHGANQAYGLNVDPRYAHFLAAYGGGMAIGHLCGAVASSVAVLGYLFIEDHAHEGEYIKELTTEFTDRYQKKMDSLMCDYLKEKYGSDETIKCRDVIAAAAEILDEMVLREQAQITKPHQFTKA